VLGHQHQGFDGGPPFRCVVLALRQLGDVGGGVAQGAQLAAVGQRDQKGPVGDELSVWSGVYADIVGFTGPTPMIASMRRFSRFCRSAVSVQSMQLYCRISK